MGAQAGVVSVQRRMPTRLKRFLPTSSLTPGTLVGVAWWPAAHPLSQTMGRDCGSPEEPTVAWASPDPGFNPVDGGDSALFLPEASRRRGCRGKWYCRAGSVPAAPLALSKPACRPESLRPLG